MCVGHFQSSFRLYDHNETQDCMITSNHELRTLQVQAADFQEHELLQFGQV